MPVFRLSQQLVFPPAELADPSGLLAVGGDLSTPRLLLAYRQGIFPWYSLGEPILWWSPDPRMVLEPTAFHCPRSLYKILKKSPFHVTVDGAFSEVIRQCARVARPDQPGSWITPEMERAFVRLHRAGHAHSVECRLSDGRLVGGLYGVAVGRCFFGESMFHLVAEASKVAFALLVPALLAAGYQLIDCQQETAHLARFGAKPLARAAFLQRLAYVAAESPEQGFPQGVLARVRPAAEASCG